MFEIVEDPGEVRQSVPRSGFHLQSFVVDPTHIDAILSVALHGPADFDPRRYPGWEPPEVGELLAGREQRLCAENAAAVGAALLAECIASVTHQEGRARSAELPGPSPTPDPGRYEFTDFGPILTAAGCCKALACLECQSCEHPDWSESAARAFCGDLLWRLISTLPGYQGAPWELSADLLQARSGSADAVIA
ncbi:MAG TPA: hypothetical protein VHZ54_13325 [Solirubrobacterales bacterium]|nr:hypothetical protein [Solirubrobacterales bacterium]